MKRPSKIVILISICVVTPFVIGVFRDYVWPGGPSYVANWKVFPLLSAMIFLTAYPEYISPAWSRSVSATLCTLIGGLAGFLLHDWFGLLFGALFGLVGSALLSVAIARDNNRETE